MQLCQQGSTAEVGQVVVGHHGVESGQGGECLKRFGAVAGRGDGHRGLGLAQREEQALAEHCMVVDQQDGGGHVSILAAIRLRSTVFRSLQENPAGRMREPVASAAAQPATAMPAMSLAP
ncbi:hypothetical protein D9M68_896420 [compost metagenome]